MTEYDKFIQVCNDHLADLKHGLCRGQCTDYDSYQYVCGQIAGVEFSIDTLNEAAKFITEEDDDDND